MEYVDPSEKDLISFFKKAKERHETFAIKFKNIEYPAAYVRRIREHDDYIDIVIGLVLTNKLLKEYNRNVLVEKIEYHFTKGWKKQ